MDIDAKKALIFAYKEWDLELNIYKIIKFL